MADRDVGTGCGQRPKTESEGQKDRCDAAEQPPGRQSDGIGTRTQRPTEVDEKLDQAQNSVEDMLSSYPLMGLP